MADVVFIHGAGDSAPVWEWSVAALGDRHRPLALDLPGHGARLAERALDDHRANAAEVARLVRQAGLAAPVLVGHSMGGGVALSYALDEARYPLRALVLVASGARLRMHPSLVEAARTRAEAEAGSPPVAVGPLVPADRCLAEGAAPAVVRWLETHSGQATAQAVYADFRANDAFDVMARLGEIRVPTLVIGGAADQMTPPKFVQFLAEGIAGAQLALLDGAGHYPMAEQRAAFDERLGAFLAALD